uniref:Uncharacterized protein n=1 Tax=Papilio xuthus TaxID=66420 RepID=I4DQP5_PAPXU|nr:unknown unsecreted protein [Papilio xuthus]
MGLSSGISFLIHFNYITLGLLDYGRTIRQYVFILLFETSIYSIKFREEELLIYYILVYGISVHHKSRVTIIPSCLTVGAIVCLRCLICQ